MRRDVAGILWFWGCILVGLLVGAMFVMKARINHTQELLEQTEMRIERLEKALGIQEERGF